MEAARSVTLSETERRHGSFLQGGCGGAATEDEMDRKRRRGCRRYSVSSALRLSKSRLIVTTASGLPERL
jgi:hypothetical protein